MLTIINNSLTILFGAILYGSTEVISFLIEKGADLSIKNDDGLTAVDYANESIREKLYDIVYENCLEFFEKLKREEAFDVISDTIKELENVFDDLHTLPQCVEEKFRNLKAIYLYEKED